MTIFEALRFFWTMRLLRRRSGRAHPFDAVAAVCSASRAFSPETTFGAVLDEDERSISIEPTEANLRSYIERLGPGSELTGALTLGGTGQDPPALSYHRDPLRSPPEDIVAIIVRSGAIAPERMWRWLAIAATAYRAQLAWLETYELGRFADEQHPHAGDRTAVPETVWWANVWSGPVVARVGRDRIEAAPWHRIEPVGDGLLLVACADPPDGDHPAALAAVADILDALQLPTVATPPNPEP